MWCPGKQTHAPSLDDVGFVLSVANDDAFMPYILTHSHAHHAAWSSCLSNLLTPTICDTGAEHVCPESDASWYMCVLDVHVEADDCSIGVPVMPFVEMPGMSPSSASRLDGTFERVFGA